MRAIHCLPVIIWAPAVEKHQRESRSQAVARSQAPRLGCHPCLGSHSPLKVPVQASHDERSEGSQVQPPFQSAREKYVLRFFPLETFPSEDYFNLLLKILS